MNISKANQQLIDKKFYKKLHKYPPRKHSDIYYRKFFKTKRYYPLQLLKHLLQTTSEHNNPTFLSNLHKLKILRRPATTSVERNTSKIPKSDDHYFKLHGEKHYHLISKTQWISSINSMEQKT